MFGGGSGHGSACWKVTRPDAPDKNPGPAGPRPVGPGTGDRYAASAGVPAGDHRSAWRPVPTSQGACPVWTARRDCSNFSTKVRATDLGTTSNR